MRLLLGAAGPKPIGPVGYRLCLVEPLRLLEEGGVAVQGQGLVAGGPRSSWMAIAAMDSQPYVARICYAYQRAPDGDYLYGFTTVGQKVEWMRANPRVCVDWDEVARHDRWVSIIAFGRYEELPDPAAGEPAGTPARPLVRAAVPEPSEEDRERQRAHEPL
ncbi:MAG: hypothetical protein J2P46_04210 [Zavarzinella sp.]|nr:hypothetical protein [Zavarzinella sp.]